MWSLQGRPATETAATGAPSIGMGAGGVHAVVWLAWKPACHLYDCRLQLGRGCWYLVKCRSASAEAKLQACTVVLRWAPQWLCVDRSLAAVFSAQTQACCGAAVKPLSEVCAPLAVPVPVADCKLRMAYSQQAAPGQLRYRCLSSMRRPHQLGSSAPPGLRKKLTFCAWCLEAEKSVKSPMCTGSCITTSD